MTEQERNEKLAEVLGPNLSDPSEMGAMVMKKLFTREAQKMDEEERALHEAALAPALRVWKKMANTRGGEGDHLSKLVTVLALYEAKIIEAGFDPALIATMGITSALCAYYLGYNDAKAGREL